MDHGSHGVAALPIGQEGYYGGENGNGTGTNPIMGGAPVGAAAPGGLPSSVQMQLQMQQMATAMMLQQQDQHNNNRIALQGNNQQQQFQRNQMMPPPPNANNGMGSSGGGAYPSLVPGMIGSQQLLGGGGGPPTVAAAAAPPTVMNTSSSGLMQALNAQIAANQAALNNRLPPGGGGNIPGAGAAVNLVDSQGNPISLNNSNLTQANLTQGGINPSNLANMGNLTNLSNMGPQGQLGVVNNNMISPGDIINGKKRVSPSVPLHPSQLLMHHGVGGVGGMLAGAGATNYMGMKTLQEGMSLNGSIPQQLIDSQQVLNPASLGIGQAVAPQGLLGAALNQALSQSTDFGLSGQHVQPSNLQKGSESAQQSSPNNPVDLSREDGHGEVLTHPSIPAANSGLDNSEGNLIVRRGDLLKIPRKNMHSHPPPASFSGDKKDTDSSTLPLKPDDNNRNGTNDTEDDYVEYRVVTLLGQGTFAQVFHCIDQKSQKAVAVKIVKNKPAYTRQAAVEIDVFRKLNTFGDEMGSESAEDGAGLDTPTPTSSDLEFPNIDSSSDRACIIRLMHYFMHSSHLCLVFEMLGPNLYELLKKRQFRGLPIDAVRTLVKQATEGIKLLGKRNVVHCDLKPENILMVSNNVDDVIAECKAKREQHLDIDVNGNSSPEKSNNKSNSKEDGKQYIKLIDFGSACFEGQTTHTYIQSRFYRSPEVLVGLPYDSAIDIWSLGCVAAELFLGLPILPGVHEHDQLGRILEMVGNIPDWMLEQGSKSAKFFKNVGGRVSNNLSTAHFGPTGRSDVRDPSSTSRSQSTWEFKNRQEYIAYLTEDEKRSKGGVSKLEQQQTNRYFKKKKLEDIVMHHGVCNTNKEREQLGLFVHFLKGVLDPDPWKRWTAHQASMHPFLTGSSVYRIKSSSSAEIGPDGKKISNRPYDIHWVPPWDASISRRKLMVIQKTKEKATAAAAQAQQQASASNRRRLSLNDVASRSHTISQSVPETGTVPHSMMPPLSTQGLDIYGSPLRTSRQKLELQSPAVSITSQMAAMADAMSIERARSNISMQSISNISATGGSSPPASLMNGGQMFPGYPNHLSASLGGVGIPLSYQQLADVGGNLAGRSLSEGLMQDPQLVAAAAAQHHQQAQSASLAGLNDIAFLQPPPPPPAYMGAQSFSGAYYSGGMPNSHHPYIESDLGYALQRPGVVPGGSDAYINALRRQNSASNPAALMAQQQHNQAMLSASLSNLSSSTPQNYGVFAAPGQAMNHHASSSPGGLLLQKLGLQEQMMLGSQQQAAGTSLLSQQMEEYSQTGAPQGGQQQQQPVNHLMGLQQQSFPSASGLSAGMMNPGSYHGHMPTSLPRNMQNSSFSDHGVNSSMQQQQNMAQQAQQAQFRMNATGMMARPDMMDQQQQLHALNMMQQQQQQQQNGRRPQG